MSRRLLSLLVPLLAVSACGAPVDGGGAKPGGGGGVIPTPAQSPVAGECDRETLEVTSPGVLTIGTDTPAYEPWFVDNTPSNGKGYESAVAYAVAEKLGFDKADVRWVTVPFNTAIAPGPKKFDFDVNQVSISDDRRQAVDFSSGYYDVRQAVVTYKGSPIDGKTAMTDLAAAKLGAQVGTTSYAAITQQIKPQAQPNVFDTNDLAVQALKNKQIDGIVVDLPTAFYMTAAQLDDGVIVGQLPTPAGTAPEQFGLVLDKGSSLTSCVSQAVDALREDGTLKRLEQQWLNEQGAPELR